MGEVKPPACHEPRPNARGGTICLHYYGGNKNCAECPHSGRKGEESK